MHTVAGVISDGANPFELAVACEVFGKDRPELGVAWYGFTLCAPGGEASLRGGWSLSVDSDLSGLETADTIIVTRGDPRRARGPARRGGAARGT